MIDLKLKRIKYFNDWTPGIILYGDRIVCVTLELPWNNNEKDISCIPCLRFYYCTRVPEQNRFNLNEVRDREGIQIHTGNYLSDTTGCILVGRKFGKNKTISDSKKAFSDLCQLLADNDSEEGFYLTIV